MVPSDRYCTRCGAANHAQDAFCFACGHPLQATPASQQYPVAGSATSTSTGLLTPNLILKQRYRILGPLGKGGFGAVYKAEDAQLGNRLLAVKEMSQSSLSQQEIAEAAENFKREALLLAALKHPNLPSIYDHFSQAGRWYLVMDFIEGETLEEYLNKQLEGHLSVEETLQFGIQLCTVLSYLHSRQPPIIFRDLKPANIMLTPEGNLYLIDFGIARHFKPGQRRDTIAFGSPGYAAPEQYGKAQTTPQSDNFSLGATLHHLLSGSDPSENPKLFLFPPLPSVTIPAELGALITRMVDIDPDKRLASMADVKQELQRIAAQPIGSQPTPIQLALPALPTPPAQTNAPGPPSQPGVQSPLSQQTQYPLPAQQQRRIPQRHLQPQPPPMRHRPRRPPVRQQSQRTGLSVHYAVGVAVIIVLAIIVAVIGTQNATTNTSINETYSTNGTPPTDTPTLAPYLSSSHGIEQYSLLLAQNSGASRSHLSSHYDSRSGSIAITETIGLTENSGIGARTVLTDCFDIEKAIWQGKIPNLETVTVNIIGPVGGGSLTPIAICTLNESTEQQFDWDILTHGQAWEEYNYTWILPGLLQG